MIPAAIIEKAARAKFYRAHPEYPADENHWENVSESYRRMFRDSVTRTLTPVYADIQAEAWEVGFEAGYADGTDTGTTGPSNPYRADELDGSLPVPAWTVPFTKIPGGSAT